MAGCGVFSGCVDSRVRSSEGVVSCVSSLGGVASCVGASGSVGSVEAWLAALGPWRRG